MAQKRLLAIITLISLFSFASCDNDYSPKPKGYFRIDLPAKQYRMYDPVDCPFKFEIPQYAEITPYHDSIAQPCWKYLNFTPFNGQLFLSYKNVEGNLETFLNDSRTLAYKHTVKADAIDESVIETPNKVYGIIYDIGGNAASSVQFFVTDSTKHFIRGALYFNVPPQPDSLAPVIKYIRKDVEHLITSLRWK